MKRHKERLLWLLLIGIASFNKADFFLTLDALERGFVEANPIVEPIVNTYVFPLVKLVLVPLILIFLWQHRHRIGDKLLNYVWIPFVSYFSLMVYFRMFIIR